MDIINTKAIIALGITGAMSVGTASAQMPEVQDKVSPILAVSSPDLRVAVYDGIATLVGTADSEAEAKLAEDQISSLEGIDHVINMITWG